MKNINIPKPCSENWNEMSPNEKGAFCQKCALDVYDFTNKSGDEIRDILTLNIGSRVCGRIEPQQLNELNYDYSAWKINNKRSFQRAWVFSLFVVFGMTLFSCEEDELPVVEKLQKIAHVILNDDKVADSLSRDATANDLKVEKQTQLPKQNKSVPDTNEIIQILGEIEYNPEIIDVIEVVDPKEPIYPLAGAMISTHPYEEYLIERQDEITPISKPTIIPVMSGLVYPNPASNETTLKVNLPKKSSGEIELLSLNGQKIRTIHSGRLPKGDSEYQIDLTDLESGIYLVVILSEGKKETIRFSKS